MAKKEHYGVFIIVGVVLVLAVALIFYSGGTVGEAKYGLARARQASQSCPPRVCPACPTPTHIMSEGESQTWVVNGVEYEIELLVVSESGEAKFKISGEITEPLKRGDGYNLNDGSTFYVTAIKGNQVEAAILPFSALLKSGR